MLGVSYFEVPRVCPSKIGTRKGYSTLIILGHSITILLIMIHVIMI